MYAYCNGNPVMYCDPSGQWAIWDFINGAIEFINQGIEKISNGIYNLIDKISKPFVDFLDTDIGPFAVGAFLVIPAFLVVLAGPDGQELLTHFDWLPGFLESDLFPFVGNLFAWAGDVIPSFFNLFNGLGRPGNGPDAIDLDIDAWGHLLMDTNGNPAGNGSQQ